MSSLSPDPLGCIGKAEIGGRPVGDHDGVARAGQADVLRRRAGGRSQVVHCACEKSPWVRRGEARKDEVAGAIGVAAHLASYVEMKPPLLGVSIDLKAPAGDFAERR